MNHIERLVCTAAGLDSNNSPDLLAIVSKTYQLYHEIFIEGTHILTHSPTGSLTHSLIHSI